MHQGRKLCKILPGFRLFSVVFCLFLVIIFCSLFFLRTFFSSLYTFLLSSLLEKIWKYFDEINEILKIFPSPHVLTLEDIPTVIQAVRDDLAPLNTKSQEILKSLSIEKKSLVKYTLSTQSQQYVPELIETASAVHQALTEQDDEIPPGMLADVNEILQQQQDL